MPSGKKRWSSLGQRFRVSYGYVKKIRQQQLRLQQMERVPHHPGRKPKFTASLREQLRGWLKQQPDLTLGELQEKLMEHAELRVSRPALWMVLRQQMGCG